MLNCGTIYIVGDCMTDNTGFINNALNEAFLVYEKSVNNKDSLDYNSFLSCIVRMLVLIYGEDVINCFKEKDVKKFDDLIRKYSFEDKDYNNFKISVDKFYAFDKKIETKPIKKKNKYFNLVQKYLIDMMLKRKEKGTVDKEKLEEFYDLLFTANSKSFYQKSYAVLVAYNPYEIDEYAKKHKLVG